MSFIKAVKFQEPVRLAIIGPSNSGKTFTALRVGGHMAKELDSRLAYIDTEHGSAKKYADQFDFDVLELTDYKPQNYIDAIKKAEEAGYKVLVIDSISHAWAGKGGVLDLVDRAKARDNRGFNAWREVTPLHNAFVEAMLSAKLHLIVTMRSKMEYAQEKDEQTGKVVIRKLGLQPVQREGVEYEFDIIGDMDQQHNFMVSKTRCSKIDGEVFPRPGSDLAEILLDWSGSGETRKPAEVEVGVPIAAAPKKRGRPANPKAEDKKIEETRGPIETTDAEKQTLFIKAVEKEMDACIDGEEDPLVITDVVNEIMTEAGYGNWEEGRYKVPSEKRMQIYLKIQKELKILSLGQ